MQKMTVRRLPVFVSGAVFVLSLLAGLSSCDMLGLTSSGGSGSAADVSFASFAFLKSDNPGLAEDCPAVLDSMGATVAVTHGVALTALKPTIVVADGIAVSPASGTALDFTTPVEFTLTAADGTKSTVIVSVEDIGTVTLSGILRDQTTGGGIAGYTIGWNGDFTQTSVDGSFSMEVSKTRSAAVGFFSRYKEGDGGVYMPMRLDLRADATLSLLHDPDTADYPVRRVTFNLFAPSGAEATTQDPLTVGDTSPTVYATIANRAGGTTSTAYCSRGVDNAWYIDTPTFGDDCLVYLTVRDNGSGLVMAYSAAGYTQYSRLYTGRDLSAESGTSIDVYEPADEDLTEISLTASVVGASDAEPVLGSLRAVKGKAGASAEWFLDSETYGSASLFSSYSIGWADSFPVPDELMALGGHWYYAASSSDSTSGTMLACRFETLSAALTASATLSADLSAAPASAPDASFADGAVSASAVDGAARYTYELYDESADEYFALSSLEPSIALPSWLDGRILTLSSAADSGYAFPEEVSGYRSFELCRATLELAY